MNLKKISIILLSGLLFGVTANVLAQNVSVPQDVTITVGGYNYSLLSTSNALDQLDVDATSFTITTNLSTGSVSVRSSDRINLGGDHNNGGIALTTCNSGESVFVIQAFTSSARVVKVVPPVSTAADFVCNVNIAAGGGGGSPPPPPPPPPPSPALLTAPPSVPPVVEKLLEKLSFKDIKPADEKFVIPLVELMLTEKTYVVPGSKRFGVKVATRGDFGLQIAAAVSGVGCGSEEKFPGIKKCRENAVKTKLVKKSFPRRALKKWEFLELLLKAKGVGTASATVKDLKKACPDVKNPTARMAGVYFAAEGAGFPMKEGGKCRLKSTFTRKEAARLGFAAMQ